jgi:hypothetical protein
MSSTYETGTTSAVLNRPYVEWGAIIAGAAVAAGTSLTLLAFGAGVGLSVSSTAPTWRDSSPWLWLLSSLYLVFVALCSFGFGGYIAGRMRYRTATTNVEEIQFRDGLHGVIMWGVAVAATALLTLAGAAITVPAAAPSGGRIGPATSVAGENIIASELDNLFRTTRHQDVTDIAYRRAEASRILLKVGGHNGVTNEDRDYLAGMVADRTGLSDADAAARTDQIIGASKDELHRAREASVLEAFMVAAALLLGAAVSWFAAEEGGRERERDEVFKWSWAPVRRTTP